VWYKALATELVTEFVV